MSVLVPDDGSFASELEYDELDPAVKIVNPDEIQVLYEGKPACACCTNWIELEPDETEAQEATPAKTNYAVIVRKKKAHGDSKEASFVVHSITVHSELAKPILSEIFKDYPNLNLDPAAPTFSAPFAPFFERWELWEATLRAADDKDLASHLELIDQVVRKDLNAAFEAREKILDDGVVNFDLAWTVLRNRGLIYSCVGGLEQLYKMTSWEYQFHQVTQEQALFVHGEKLQWNGYSFVPMPVQVLINKEFTGFLDIRKLDAYPLEFHPDPEAVMAKLVARGQRYASLRGIQCKEHDETLSLTEGEGSVSRKHNSKNRDRIIIDAGQYECEMGSGPPRQYPHYHSAQARPPPPPPPMTMPMPTAPGHHPLPGQYGGPPPPPPGPMYVSPGHMPLPNPGMPTRPPIRPGTVRPQWIFDSDSDSNSDSDSDDGGRARRRRRNGRRRILSNTEAEGTNQLSDEELAICSPLLKGYSLSQRQWKTFEIDHIKDVQWNTQAFNQIALPEEFKELIQATIEMQVKQEATFDDFISGKGKGLITLLSGSPGVGKTATVEAMSEMLKVPLYHISAADLGTTAADIDEKLRDILKLTARWNAVLLLDEADIFLEQRAPTQIKHNAIVSTFLQTLEYHEGVLCMTTNRPHTLDRAVLSRVHLNLIYPDLDASARKAIWRRFAAASAKVHTTEDATEAESTSVRGVDISEAEFDTLAQSELDGRQIKNVFKTAALLAAWKAQPLDYTIVRRALKIVEMQIRSRQTANDAA